MPLFKRFDRDYLSYLEILMVIRNSASLLVIRELIGRFVCNRLQISHMFPLFWEERKFMNHEIMTIEEVAEYLRVSERTVYDWAQKGQLPGGKLGTTWRFKRSEIEHWVNRQLGSPVPVASATSSGGALTEILTLERVVFIDSSLKEDALKQLAAKLSTSPLVHNHHELETSIFRREELMSTGIGLGVGVPHVRLESVDDLVMALGIARTPLTNYASLDKEPVQIVCMVAAGGQQHSQYIRALSAISSRLKNKEIREQLIAAADEQAAFKIFTGEDA